MKKVWWHRIFFHLSLEIEHVLFFSDGKKSYGKFQSVWNSNGEKNMHAQNQVDACSEALNFIFLGLSYCFTSPRFGRSEFGLTVCMQDSLNGIPTENSIGFYPIGNSDRVYKALVCYFSTKLSCKCSSYNIETGGLAWDKEREKVQRSSIFILK